jgi:hypothetical protein
MDPYYLILIIQVRKHLLHPPHYTRHVITPLNTMVCDAKEQAQSQVKKEQD